jgi:hypothetical protein
MALGAGDNKILHDDKFCDFTFSAFSEDLVSQKGADSQVF